MKLKLLVPLLLAGCMPMTDAAPAWTPAGLDSAVRSAMAATGARGLAVAVIDHGKVAYVQSHGVRNARGQPLEPRTIMYGASLTKAAFGYVVMQLVDEGVIDLDAPIGRYLKKPLPDYPSDDRYGPWPDLAGDPRWREITPRMLLSHSAGLPNYEWLEPDGKLHLHFAPGSRYAYSGTGIILLQFVLEEGLGIDVGREMQRRVFDRFGMPDSSLIWRPDFAANLADGWDVDGKVEPHDERSAVRAAGSLDTTIGDFARFAAGYVRGDGLSAPARAELTTPQLAITTPAQFPTFLPELPADKRRADLAAGLGVVVFDGPQGHGFFKGGHNDTTGNMWVCLEARQACIVLLANDVRAEAAFPRLVRAALGDTGMPWDWEYGEMKLLP